MRIAALGLVCWFAVRAEAVKLTVRTAGDQTTFHIGEAIQLELSFTSDTPNTYQISTASHDRSSGLAVESFQVEPTTGWDDPLALYFQSYGGFIGSGLSGVQKLSTQPAVIRHHLNEWVRFNQPGRYRVVVTSTRVRGADAGPLSGELTLTIIPATPEWQAATLDQARALLAHAPAPEQAVATVRYLGTPAAAREMARGLADQSAYQYKLGLAGTPAKDDALKAMHELLEDPDFPVNGLFLDTMSVVALPPGKTEDRPQERAELETKFRSQLVDALGRKRGKALAISAYTIVDEAAMRQHDLPDDQKQRLTAALVSGFDGLPAQAQIELFQTRWRVLDKKAMLALLPKAAGLDNDQMSGGALIRWFEMDPQGARPAIIHEIERPRPRFGASILGILPDKELPEADLPLADHLTQGNNAASLISRYATAAIEPQVTAYLAEQAGKLACAVQAPLLAYLLRVDPQGAKLWVEKAIAARGEGFTACNHGLFTEVGGLHNEPLLEELALQSLDDGDPQVVAGAAAYLGTYGSAAAEAPLWAHFTVWSNRWHGREEELKSSMAFEAGAGRAMLSALVTGQGWLTDEAKLTHLLELSVGTDQHGQIDQDLKSWQAKPFVAVFNFSDKETFKIAQYNPQSRQIAIEKLNQFHRGTTFLWIGPAGLDGEGNAFEEVSRAVAAHGLTIVKPIVKSTAVPVLKPVVKPIVRQ